MKKNIVNVLATTAVSLILLSLVALFFHAQCIYLQTIFQVFGVNIIVHFGLYFICRLEIKSFVFEVVLDTILIVGILMIFGTVFHWLTSTPIWILVIMGIAIYMISALLNLFYMRHEAQEINTLIKRREKKI